jgi:predicted AAA+ superfamily ATPase
LRARYKTYLADAAIAPAVLLKGNSILDDPKALGIAAETAVFKHLFTRYYPQNVRFTYWRGKKDWEVDLIAEIEGQIIPFEVKYRSHHSQSKNLQGLLELCQQKKIARGYVITKSLDDFGILGGLQQAQIMRIPAALFCYWMGEAELTHLEGRE